MWSVTLSIIKSWWSNMAPMWVLHHLKASNELNTRTQNIIQYKLEHHLKFPPLSLSLVASQPPSTAPCRLWGGKHPDTLLLPSASEGICSFINNSHTRSGGKALAATLWVPPQAHASDHVSRGRVTWSGRRASSYLVFSGCALQIDTPFSSQPIQLQLAAESHLIVCQVVWVSMKDTVS